MTNIRACLNECCFLQYIPFGRGTRILELINSSEIGFKSDDILFPLSGRQNLCLEGKLCFLETSKGYSKNESV